MRRASARIIIRRRPKRSDAKPKPIPPRIAPPIATMTTCEASFSGRRWKLLRKVGYMSCVPCDDKFIIAISSVR